MDFALKKSNLNFRVYTSETMPTEPGQENDIVIISSTSMKNWIMSPNDPSGAPRTTGDVWIKYNVKDDLFNALKQSSLMISTISAWQYVGDAWREVTAKSCRNGKWVDWWHGELYVNGNQYESATGGWKVVNGAGETATLAANCITFAKTGNDDRSASAYTQNSIDVTKHSELVVSGKIITASSTSSKDAIVLGLTSTNTGSEPTSWLSTFKHTLNTVGTFEYALKIKSVEGSYYVALYAHASDVEIYTVRLK